MRPCPTPLDPIDAEALAAGAEPVLRADAATHARVCPPCQALVNGARALREALEGLPPDFGMSEAPPDLTPHVMRLRAFSPRERRTYALWNAPILLTVGLAGAGIALLERSALRAAEQVSAGATALLPLAALARSAGRWAVDLVALAPAGLEGLSQGLRQEGLIGAAALGLLAPLALGLRKVLARAPGRR